jgi:DNA-binding NarL/FixJ family response regulator
MHITLHAHEISSALQFARTAHTAVCILLGSIPGPSLGLLMGGGGETVPPPELDVPEKAKISLLLIEDNRLLREGIAVMLSEQPDLAVVATSPSADAVLPLVRDAKPQLVLLDSGLGEHDSLRLLEAVKEAFPDIRVIVMDLLPAPQDIVEFVAAGCSGFILKDATLEDFVSTIRSVAQGIPVLPPPLMNTIFSHVARQALSRDSRAVKEAVTMTRREREVVALIGEGLSNKEIAERLHVAVRTVKSHMHNVLKKLALHTRLQVAAYAHRRRDLSE